MYKLRTAGPLAIAGLAAAGLADGVEGGRNWMEAVRLKGLK